MGYFVGVDCGKIGGLGVVDQSGQVVGAHRWRPGSDLYNILSLIKNNIIGDIYIELVQVFPGLGRGLAVQTQSLFVNMGIWQGWCIALDIGFITVSPLTWQAAFNLTHWQAEKKVSPLELARQLFPGAALGSQADSGKAVALLLADLARRDHVAGLDRGAKIKADKEKTKARRRRLKAKKEFLK